MRRKPNTIIRTLDLGILGEVDVEVEYIYSPGTPDVYYLRNGDPGYPGDPAEVEILKVMIDGENATWLLCDKLQEDEDLLIAISEQEDENQRNGGYDE